MKWREVKNLYLWHYSSSLEHNCVVADRNHIKTQFKLSNKYYSKEKFNDYPKETIQKILREEFFEQKFYAKLIDYIFTSL